MGPWTANETAGLNGLNIILGLATLGVVIAVAAGLMRDLLERRHRR
jgi:hypothetical protein